MTNSIMTETKTVKIGDAEFTIGRIKYRFWNPIRFKISAWLQPLLRAQEKHPEKPPAEVWSAIEADIGIEKSIQLNELYGDAKWQAIKHGVRNHTGLKSGTAAEIPFAKDGSGLVSDEVIELYAALGLLDKLSAAVCEFQTMTESERKN